MFISVLGQCAAYAYDCRINRGVVEMRPQATSFWTAFLATGSASLLAAWGALADPSPSRRGTAEPAVERVASPMNGDAAIVTGMAMRVFFAACVKSPLNEAAAREWLQANGFHAAPPAHAAPFLRGTPGTAWPRADPASVAIPLAVVMRSGGPQCEVMTPVSDPGAAASSFQRMITGLEQPGLVVRKERDDNAALGGGPGRFLLYRVGVPPTDQGDFHFAMSARPPVASGIALLMTAARAAPR